MRPFVSALARPSGQNSKPGLISHYAGHSKNFLIFVSFFLSIVPGTKSACLLVISLTFCPMKQTLKTLDTPYFLVLVGWSMLHCTKVKKTSRVPTPLQGKIFLNSEKSSRSQEKIRKFHP